MSNTHRRALYFLSMGLAHVYFHTEIKGTPMCV